MQWVAFLLFSATQVGTYLAIRRGWLPPMVVAAAGVVFSISTMLLFSLWQGNVLLHALLVGVLLGGLFSAAIIAAAWYFQRQENA
jgi:hypothetical protein